jgi:P-aminobenzoate N-oxygenase AurF
MGSASRLLARRWWDEAYHELLVLKACQVTREKRGLGAVTLPESQLIVKMRQAQAQCSAQWQKVLVHLAHGSIFKGLTKCLYGSLSQHERAFFIEVLPKPVRWFANIELEVWQAMLQHIGFRATDPVILDCRSANEENLARIDYADLIALAQELDLLEGQRGLDSFARAGLVK